MGGLDQGVDPFLRFQAGVSCAAADLHGVHADTLAPDLQCTAVGRGLEHEHVAARDRPLLDERARRERPDLLVTRDQQLHGTAIGERG